MANLEELAVALTLDTSEFDAGIGEATAGVEAFTGSAESKLAGLAGGALLGVGAAFAAVGGVAFDFASQTSQSVNDLQAQLGLTAAEAEDMGGVVKDVFANNFGDSIEDVTQATAAVQNQFNALGVSAGDDLGGVVEDAFRIRDVFDIDIAESAGAAAVLMDEFGLSSDEAYDFITKGAQSGLNAQGDLLETISEYGNLFGEGQFSAEEFYSILETGSAGGVLGTDKVADAFKELGIRLLDGSDATKEALEGLGLNEVMAGIRDGTVSVADAFPLIQDALAGIEDPIAQTELAVALFGTQWEDLGAQMMLALDTGTTSLAEMAGATDSLNVKYNNLGSVVEGLWRNALIQIEPVGAKLLDIANTAVPHIISGMEQIGPAVTTAFAWLSENGNTIVPILAGIGAVIIAAVVPGFIAWATAASAAALATLAAMAPLIPPLLAIGAVVGLVTAAWVNNWGGIQEKTGAVVAFLGEQWVNLQNGFNFVVSGAQTLYTNVVSSFTNMQTGAQTALSNLQSGALEVWNMIYSNTWGKVTELWNNIIARFTSANPETVAKIVALREDAAKVWGEIVSRVTGFVTQLWTNTIGKFQTGVTEGTNKIEEFKKGVTEKFNALVSPVTEAVEKVRAVVSSKFEEAKSQGLEIVGSLATGISNLASTFLSAAGDIASSVIDGFVQGIQNGADSVISSMVDLATGALQAAKDALGISSPSKAMYDIGTDTWLGEYNALMDGAKKLEEAGRGLGEAVLIGRSEVASPDVGRTTKPGLEITIGDIDARGAMMSKEEYEEVTERKVGELLSKAFGRSLAIQG